MNPIYLLVLLTLVFSGCGRNPPSRSPLASTQNQLVVAAQFSPDGRRIITTSKDGNLRIWDATGQALSSTNGVQMWDLPTVRPMLPRYEAGTPDNMPIVGGDSFKVLQDQIDALEKRVRELEKSNKPGR